MCLPALPGQHDTQAPDLSKFAVRIFVESLDYPLASPANKEITGTALARDKFGISQMVRSVRFFLRLPDADHDSWEGDLLPALDPLCIRVCFFGFIALVFPGAMPLPLYHIFPTSWPGSPTICSGVASGYAGDRQTGYSVANTQFPITHAFGLVSFGVFTLVSPGTIFHTLIPHLSNKLARLSDNLVRCRVRLSQRSADGVFCR